MTDRELIEKAFLAREKSYCPYSGFSVGACLLSKSGKYYLGCNIENGSFTPTVCAERTALFSAIANGDREFDKIAVVGGKGEETVFATPCGVCRQALSEFCQPDMPIIVAKSVDEYKIYTMGELLAHAFFLK